MSGKKHAGALCSDAEEALETAKATLRKDPNETVFHLAKGICHELAALRSQVSELARLIEKRQRD